MPTVDELIEMVARETGLDDGSGSQERADIVTALSRAYRRVCAETSRLIPDTADISAALSTTFAAIDAGLVEIDSVWRVSDDGDRLIPLDRYAPERLREMQDTDGGGTPTAYAVEHGNLLLDTYETTGTVSTIRVYFSARPAALVDGGTEASIAGIDPIYHEDLVGTLAVCYVLEGAEGEEQRAAYFRGLVYDPQTGSMTLFKRSLVREGGVNNVRGDDPTRYDTPAPRSAR